jgi:hypothetical protein
MGRLKNICKLPIKTEPAKPPEKGNKKLIKKIIIRVGIKKE